MNLPNKLTLGRIILVPLMVAALLIDFPFNNLVALIIFAAASITDLLDGKIARKQNLVTDFGKFADPLADKILVLATLLCFVQNGYCDCVAVIIVLFREFSVTSIRLIAASSGEVIAANIWGKVKTVSQIIAIILIFVLQIFLEILNMDFVPVGSNIVEFCAFIFNIIGNVALWISTIICVISGVIYIWDNKKFISEK